MSERERERLNRRIGAIRGTDTARDLRSYRNRLMRKAPKAGEATTASSAPGAKRDYWHWEDEIRLCHDFLDGRNVPAMKT